MEFEITGRSVRVLRLKQVLEKIGIARSTVYDRLNPTSARYDPHFPRPIRLGGNAVGWFEKELDLWLSLRNRT